MSELRKLIEAVEAGHFLANDALSPRANENVAYRAFSGSVDAARALHKGLLPYDYTVSSNMTGFAHVWRDEYEVTHNWTALVPGNEGRASLLVILKAYEAAQ